MNVKPIPKSLLKHTCKLTHNTVDDWGDPTAENDVNIDHVRVEPSSKIVVTKENQEVQLSAVLFYDCTNSHPQGTTFSVEGGDVVTFNGKEYAVKSVETLYADKTTPHHLEIGLV